MKKYLFSIVIPTYNGEKTVGRLLGKLATITGNYSKEVVVIDSESRDSTLEIVKSFKNKISNLRIINIKKKDFNHGETRNLGVRMSQGKYICFFSQDAVPRDKNIFSCYLEDFNIDDKVVAIFGKHVPYENTPIIQKLEILCKWEKMDQYVNHLGRLIQNLEKPFIPFTEENKLLWYMLSNTSSCYRRSFLIQNPFPKAEYGEDLLMGKTIIEKELIKVYDIRCAVTHSHTFNIPQYYAREQEDLTFRRSLIGKNPKTNISCKIKKIFSLEEPTYKKMKYLFEFFIYYGMKVIIIIKIK